RGLNHFEDKNLLIGSATSDDAGIYRLSDEIALVQTLDFFTPIVDDPYTYGQIAATNSLSDVYAMGGRPLTAMNIVGMPVDLLELNVINEILKGGADKVREAKCSLVGGHSIKNPEPIYGLSVTGIVHPQKIMSNAGGREGDLLVLTKPLGTGILSTGIKKDLVKDEALIALGVKLMSTLNLPGSEVAGKGLVRGGTDVTGFGLLGHLLSLCQASGVSAELDSTRIPMIGPEIIDLIEKQKCVPGGTRENLRNVAASVDFAPGVSEALRLLLADAQTSGGLLCCVPEANLAATQDIFAAANTLCNVVIGRIVARKGQSRIAVK
ncbi:MAG: selenide, water dikinase SelD, partial [Verrucomicrobiales bacterium]